MNIAQQEKLQKLINSSSILNPQERIEWASLLGLMNDKQLGELERILSSAETGKPRQEIAPGPSAPLPLKPAPVAGLSHIVNVPKMAAVQNLPTKPPGLPNTGFAKKLKTIVEEKEIAAPLIEKKLPEHTEPLPPTVKPPIVEKPILPKVQPPQVEQRKPEPVHLEKPSMPILRHKPLPAAAFKLPPKLPPPLVPKPSSPVAAGPIVQTSQKTSFFAWLLGLFGKKGKNDIVQTSSPTVPPAVTPAKLEPSKSTLSNPSSASFKQTQTAAVQPVTKTAAASIPQILEKPSPIIQPTQSTAVPISTSAVKQGSLSPVHESMLQHNTPLHLHEGSAAVNAPAFRLENLEDLKNISSASLEDEVDLLENLQKLIQKHGYYKVILIFEKSSLFQSYINSGISWLNGQSKADLSKEQFEKIAEVLVQIQTG